MAFLSSFDISASGMSAQRLRMDIASENIANMDATRTEGGGAYKRKESPAERRVSGYLLSRKMTGKCRKYIIQNILMRMRMDM